MARLCSTSGFANTSSAIKHSDSVEGKSQIQISHSIHLSFSSYSKKKNTCKLFMSPQIFLSTSHFFPFAPVSFFLIFKPRTERRRRSLGTSLRCSNVRIKERTEGSDKILSLMFYVMPTITLERKRKALWRFSCLLVFIFLKKEKSAGRPIFFTCRF